MKCSRTPAFLRLQSSMSAVTISQQAFKLTKDRNSMLGVMFSEKFDMKPAEDDAFFIDRDGTHFRFILNYLRTGKLTLPEGVTALNELQEEAEFYRIKGMLDELEFNSEILTNNEHRDLLLGWLPSQNTEKRRRRLRLLFRASRDGFLASTFHSKCDNKGPTVTIVQSEENIFGGFTEESWSSKYSNILRFMETDKRN